jgi:hypothetical protein
MLATTMAVAVNPEIFFSVIETVVGLLVGCC